MGVTLERKPSTEIFMVSAVFLEPESAIFAHEDINAIVTYGTVEGCYDSSGHGGSREISKRSQ